MLEKADNCNQFDHCKDEIFITKSDNKNTEPESASHLSGCSGTPRRSSRKRARCQPVTSFQHWSFMINLQHERVYAMFNYREV